MSAILVENLSRTFNGRTALDQLSFKVEEGEIFGFLGPNGAGKTTTIRVLTGQLRPTSGMARVAGWDVVKQTPRLKPEIGVVFEYQNLYERMSGLENLAFSARLYGAKSDRQQETLNQVGLGERANDRVRTYSNGMKQRLMIARALLHRPRVLFLDEPTRGLDPGVAREIRDLASDLASQGVTIFLTTHYMEEADELCTRVAFLDLGRIVALDTPLNLKAVHGLRSVRVKLMSGEQITLSLDDELDGVRLGDLASGGQVLSVHSTEATLEEIFIKLTGRRLEP